MCSVRQLSTLVSPCSLNDMLHSSLLINWTVAAAAGKGLCMCFVNS